MSVANDPRLQIMSMICVPLYLFDPHEVAIVWANDSALDYWETASLEELLTRDLKRQLTTALKLRLEQITKECFEKERSVVEHWTIKPDKNSKSSDYRISPYTSECGKPLLLMHVLHQGITNEAETAYCATALVHTSTMISAYGSDLNLVYCNEAARVSLPESMTTAKQRIVESSDLKVMTQLVISTGQCDINAQVLTSQGVRWHALHIQRCINPITAKTMYVVTESDITEQRSTEEEAYRLAFTDSLTNLPNRAALNNHLNEILSSEAPKDFAVLFLDLDRFKLINDSLGHNAGDQLLVFVAKQLQQALGDFGLVYRIGGDEFVALATHTADKKILKHIADQILLAMATPVVISGHKLRALPSIGICTYPADGRCASELMENADTAMYIAKAKKCGYRFYDAMMSTSISENVKERMDLENDMIAALENNEFELYFQPKVHCNTLAVTGVEALIRWDHPTRGMVMPEKFITLAEETGQIIDIGKWVLHAAMLQQCNWHKQGLDISVSINISPRQLTTNDLLADVSAALAKTGCQPHMIELEITETMLIGDPDAVAETLHKLSAIGMRLALDDFGTGFANLDSLQKYPLDCLKIDRVFLSDRKRSMLMSTILKMGKVLGLEIVAEGVETTAQIEWLAANDCDQMQGFIFSEPLPADQITPYLYDNGAPRNSMIDAA